ncbi:unnamed protein product [Ceutorhynchus assimilis]|uniref:Uncharacterized protein n=1 Tax=Ceutorhynchus assimilis TaxID=467358 RepID=A0A9N9MSE2_9CUCU|nr:unnamed protein product [Ceutorhynchus assimilis]
MAESLDSKRGQAMLTESDLLQLEEKIERIKVVYDEFNEVQNQIELAASDDNLEKEYEIRSAFEDTYYSHRSIAMSILGPREPLQDNNEFCPPKAIDINNITHISDPKLPRIDIQIFNKTISALMDTGSSINIIRSDLVADFKIDIKVNNQKFVSACGETPTSSGTIDLDFSINSLACNSEFILLPKLQEQ